MCSQILTRKSTAPSSGNFCWLADLDLDSFRLIKLFTFKTSDSKCVLYSNICLEIKTYSQLFLFYSLFHFFPKCQVLSAHVPYFLLCVPNIFIYSFKHWLQIYLNICLWSFHFFKYIQIFVWGGFSFSNMLKYWFGPFFKYSLIPCDKT